MRRPKRIDALSQPDNVPNTQATVETSITLEKDLRDGAVSDSQLQCVEKLATEASDNLPPGMPVDAQKALADLVTLPPELKDPANAHLIPVAQVALKGLLSTQPNVTLSKTLVENLERSTRNNPSSRRMRGKGSILVMAGLGALLYVAIPAIFVLTRPLHHHQHQG
jgi:hypothetical protein